MKLLFLSDPNSIVTHSEKKRIWFILAGIIDHLILYRTKVGTEFLEYTGQRKRNRLKKWRVKAVKLNRGSNNSRVTKGTKDLHMPQLGFH